MEAFRIPTGSMAETLRGSHYSMRCMRCGFSFDVGSDGYSSPMPQCPSCNFVMPSDTPVPISNGDRILVLKSIYQFSDPRRWDVVVFKNPLDPRENYIKRMIALPGETVEIIDGDIYINGAIARKPPKVQEEMWMPVYINDFQPTPNMAEPGQPQQWSGNKKWTIPFENTNGSQWNTSGATVFSLNDESPKNHTIAFTPATEDAFKAMYGYNSGAFNFSQPICSDLMVRYYINPLSNKWNAGTLLEKNGITYKGQVNSDGSMTIEKIVDDQCVEKVDKSINIKKSYQASHFQFANVDHQLVLEFEDEILKLDMGRSPDVMGTKDNSLKPAVSIFASGKMQLIHLGIYRDTHYISRGNERAGSGKPFTLEKDQFFVCGDNSPNSLDARLWSTEGKGNGGKTYRTGVVPRDYLMGKAFLVYWSNAFRPNPNLMPIIPNLSQTDVIYGGSTKEY